MPILTTLAIAGLAVAAWKELKNKHASKKIKPQTQALKTIENDASKNISELVHYQQLSFTALALMGVGIFYPPFALLGIPILTYNYFHFLKIIHHTLFTKKKVALALFEFLSVTGIFITGHYFVAAFISCAFFSIQKIVLQTERTVCTDFKNIFGSFPKKVWLLNDTVEIEVSLESLDINDIIIVRAGETIAIDGVIIKGEGTIDQCMLTGEFQAVEKSEGDEVFASTILLSGYLQIQINKHGTETIAGQIVEALENTINFKTDIQSKGEAIVESGAKKTLWVSALSLPIIGLSHTLALTYAGFGYQMQLAAPLMVLNYLRILSQQGILVKDGRALEILHQIDVFIFDKTGTLTQEIPEIVQIIPITEFADADKLLQYAASAEQHQQHPIAQAIINEAVIRNVDLLPLQSSDYEMGHGIQVVLKRDDNKETALLLGSVRFMKKLAVKIPETIEQLQKQANQKGHSLVYIAFGNKTLVGVIELCPSLRTEAFEVIQQLHQRGKEVCIISGDQAATTQYLAETLVIEHYYAEVLPEEKANIVAQLKIEGKKVCFIGDGINDAVALQTADVSVSLQGAASIAIDAADLVLIKPDLSSLLKLLDTSLELDQRLNKSMTINMVSSCACVSGVLFLGMGLSAAVIFYYSTLGLNIGQAMLPLLKDKD